ncbi:hypothetical protein JB92DRAFT_3221875 [Gautieria morchelliformis]|nr:hypothetical protein JB92DRAFT_3221875 [Gautieria morchelliformis]
MAGAAAFNFTSSEKDPSFHVVAFSLPGYGFSEASKTKGFAAAQYTDVGHKLMQGHGYEEYGGSVIRSCIHPTLLSGVQSCKVNTMSLLNM